MPRILLPAMMAALFLTACQQTRPIRTFEGEPPADGVATLWVPPMLDPLTVDGQDVRDSSLLPVNTTHRLDLLPGRREVVVRYSGLSGGPPNQQVMIESPPLSVSFEAIAGRNYTLRHRVGDDDLRFVKNPTNVSVWVEETTAPDPAHAQPGARSPAEPARKAEPAPLPAKIQTHDTPVSPGQPNALEELKRWWKQASPQERGAFLNWTVGNP
jgi:hypothetical protein